MSFLQSVQRKYTASSAYKTVARFENETFELDEELKDELQKHDLLGDIVELPDGEAKLTPEAAKRLEKSYNLQSSGGAADENFEDVKKSLKDEAEKAIKKVAGRKAKDFDVDVKLHIKDSYVVYDGACAVVRVKYKGDVAEIDSVYTKGERDLIGETIREWPQWAFWLMDDASPLRDDAFIEDWETNEISRGLSEPLSYREHIDDLHEKVTDAVKTLLAGEK